MPVKRLAGDPQLPTQVANHGLWFSHRGHGHAQLGWRGDKIFEGSGVDPLIGIVSENGLAYAFSKLRLTNQMSITLIASNL